jgi:hypothetical protein
LAGFIGLWIGNHQIPHGDFFVFWTSGKHFLSGESLYATKASGLTFLYTPFAAMIHAAFGAFPLKTASAIFTSLQLFCLFAIIRTSWDWFVISPQQIWGWGISWLVTLWYFYLNIVLVQNNIFLFTIIFYSLKNYLNNKILPAIVLLAIATLFKMQFVLLLGWMILYPGRNKILLYLPLCLLVGVGIPMLFRQEYFLIDWKEYYHFFWSELIRPSVFTDYRNQSLLPSLTRLFNVPTLNANYAPVQIGWIHFAYLRPAIKIISILLYFYTLLNSYVRSPNKPHLSGAAHILVVCLLISPLTWTQHLVFLWLATWYIVPKSFNNWKNLSLLIFTLPILTWSYFWGTEFQFYVYSLGIFTGLILMTWIILCFYKPSVSQIQ